MITRKRQRSPRSPATTNIVSKRSRTSTKSKKNQRRSVIGSSSSLNSSASDLYPIRSILEERPDEFLIDWEDDLITGEKYSPSWQPKRNVSKEAIEFWQQTTHQRFSQKKARSKRRSRSGFINTSSLGSSAERLTQHSGKSRLKRVGRAAFEDHYIFGNTDERQEASTVALQPVIGSNVVVQISQHSSLDPGQYLQYHSSVSVHDLLSSAPPHEDSGLGESSPPPGVLDSSKSNSEGIVPDSQSLPDSSSYRPTASTTGYTSIHYRPSPHCSLDSTGDNSPVSHISEFLSDPVEDSSGIFVAASPENRFWSQRSASVPIQGITQSSRSSLDRSVSLATFARSISDPTPLVLNSQESLSAHAVVHSNTRQLLACEGHRENIIVSKEDGRGYQRTEIPNSSESSSQNSNHPLRGSFASRATSQAIANSSGTVELGQPSSFRVSRARKRHNRSNHFSIAEDTIADSQPTQSTDSSVLSARNTNSQPERRPPSTIYSYEEITQSKEVTEASSSLVLLDIPDLPVTDGSRTPPQAPTLSTMSQTPQAPMSVSPRDSPGIPAPGSSGRLKTKDQLQAMRASVREAAGRRLGGKEPGRPPPPIMTNEMAVQANNQYSPNITQSLQRPQSVFPSQISTPEKQASPASNRISNEPSTTQAPSTIKPPEKVGTEQNSVRTSATQQSIISQDSAPATQMESRIDTQALEVPVEVPLPLRASQPDAYTPTHPSKLSFHQELSSVSQVENTLLPVELGKMEFPIPLALSARVRDQYLAVINVNSTAIQSIERDDPSDAMLKVINEMLARLNRITTHIDLDDPTTENQKDTTTAEELAAWAEFNSEKFKFLKCLFDHVRNDQVHIAIIAQAGRLLNIVETFLKGVQVAYVRPDTYAASESGTTKGRLEVSLIASGKEGSSAVPKAADLVVALDQSFRADDIQVAKLRNHLTNVGQLAPIVHLLVEKSVEHVEKCIPSSSNLVERVRRIVSCLTQISHEVGHLQPIEYSSSAAAEEVAAIIKEGGLEHYWESFPKMAPIERIMSIEYCDELEADAQDNTDVVSERLPGAFKRALNGDESSRPGKRQRMALAADVTHISDSVAQGSQSSVSSLTNALQEARAENAYLRGTHAKHEAALKASHAERETGLKTDIVRVQQQLEEYNSALSGLQERFEDRSRIISDLRREKTSLESTATVLERKRDALTNENSTLKEKCKSLEGHLLAARDALLASPASAIVNLEKAEAQIRQNQADKTALERKLEYAKNENELVRNTYQEASKSAMEFASRISTLEAENKILQTKASATAVDLAVISQRNENAVLQNQNAGLEAKLTHTEDVLRRKEEEIRELRRGRGMGTRGTSVKPGGSPRGSRGVSPVAGEPMLRTGSKGLGSTLRYGLNG